MKVQQLYTNCLAEAAYYIESNGEAVIIDPLRESKPYLQLAEQNGSTIKYVLETHFHADFVSGHIDLAAKTGATIVYGPGANPDFDCHIASDGEILKVGDVSIKVLHTPGHTMESSTYLLLDENGKEHAIFTGDTLFIGDVGRPDLAIKTDLGLEDLAGHLFDSLRNKIMTLPNHVIVYPAHGAGSSCGKNMSKETYDTLGHQKESNYALRANMTREEFIKEVTTGLTPAPQYFPKNALMNKSGYKGLDEIIHNGLRPLGIHEFTAAVEDKKALILDTRHQSKFVQGYVPNSLFIGIDGSFAMWVGALIENLNTPILIVSEEGREEEVITRLARVGYDNPVGYLQGGFQAWMAAGKPVASIDSISIEEFEKDFDSNLNTLDVRKCSEYDNGHLVGAQNLPLDFIYEKMSQANPNTKYHVYCAGGYRSVIACSIFKQNGYNGLVNIEGGYGAIKESYLPKTEAATVV